MSIEDELADYELAFVVEETFNLSKQGLVAVSHKECAYDRVIMSEVILKLPDGSCVRTMGNSMFACPNSDQIYSLGLPHLSKDEVPIGTEVWCIKPKNMEIDESLSKAFKTSVELNWTQEIARSLIAECKECFPDSVLDWDTGVPEQWARIVTPDHSGVLHVTCAMLIPAPVIMIDKLSRKKLKSIPRRFSIEILEFFGWDREQWKVDAKILDAFFHEPLSQNGAVDFNSLSPNDLWWLTVTL